MTDSVVSVVPATPFSGVAQLLADHDISGVPVLDEDDRVVGVVSESDLLTQREPTARDLMTAPAVTVHAEETVAEAARLMVRRGVERLPVVDEEERLVGMVTRRDLLRVFLRPDAEIRRRVREEVMPVALGPGADEVDVHVLDGVVTLHGRVRRQGHARTLVGLTEQVDGVVAVVDRLSMDEDAMGFASTARSTREITWCPPHRQDEPCPPEL
ncbi:CBS domain-containing protein [Streptomyces sp. NPDC058326]|uniref:CBS domain-containing protein n=1 Tax=Streptomyces sp. NPDC058326 TaxID=3346447 RepID=UPI0036EA0200